MTGAYYRGAVGALVVYDIAKLSTYDNVPKWLDEIKRYTSGNDDVISTTTGCDNPAMQNTNKIPPRLTTMLVGNKLDLRHLRSVPTIEAQQWSRNERLFFTETSALDATNVEKAFRMLIQEIYDRVRQRELNQAVLCGSGLQHGSQSLNIENCLKSTVKVKNCQPTTCKMAKVNAIASNCKKDIKGFCPKLCC